MAAHAQAMKTGACAFAAMLVAQATMADPIDYALVSKTDGEITVEIRLTCAHRYESHEPTAATRDVMLRLTRIAGCSGAREDEHDSDRPAGREMAGLESIAYDSRGDEATLGLRFRDPARIEVRQRGDLRSVRIVVRPEPGAAASVAPKPPPPLPPPAARVDAPARVTAPAAPAGGNTGDYVIHLETSTGPPDASGVPAPLAAAHRIYIVDTTLEGKRWQQLRLGFYATETDAEADLATLRARYPRAWIARVDAAERARSEAARIAGPASATALPAPAGPLGADQVAATMADARAAFLDEKFAAAVALYTRVLEAPPGEWSAEALEFRGVAHDRAGETPAALADYRRYLSEHPEGEGAARVRQRLDALATAREAPKASLRASPRRGDNGGWDSFGSFSQYYRRDAGDYDNAGMTTWTSLVQTDGDLQLRKSGERYDFTTRATLGYDWDLADDSIGGGNRTRVYDLYADLSDRDLGLDARLGRQTERNSGVLGRYDGARVSWLARPDVRLNVMGGYPVYLSSDGLDSDRVFYALSVDLESLAEGLDTSFFFNTQDIDGMNDRQAVGAEVRYFDGTRVLAGVVDYDIGLGTLNTLTLTGNWTFGDGTVVSGTADYRRSPFPLAEDALIGQGAGSIDELLGDLTEDQIRDLAVDRTGEVLTYSLGLSRPLAERWQVNADFSVTQIAEGPGSGGVLALPDSGTEYYAYATLVGSSLFTEGDVSLFGVRYADTDMTTDATLFVDSRFPVTNRLRLNPVLAVTQRQVQSDDSSEWLLRPAMRLLYRFGGHYEIDLQGGAEIGSRSGGDVDSDTTAYFVYMGYRADF